MAKKSMIIKQQKTQKERLFLYKKNIDYTLSFLMLLCSAFLYYRVYKLSFFSFDWMWKIAALLIIMNIIFILQYSCINKKG